MTSGDSTPEKQVDLEGLFFAEHVKPEGYTYDFQRLQEELNVYLDEFGENLEVRFINPGSDHSETEYFTGFIMSSSELAADSSRNKFVTIMLVRSEFGDSEGAISIYRNEILPGLDITKEEVIFNTQIAHIYDSSVIDWYSRTEPRVPEDPTPQYATGAYGPYIHRSDPTGDADATIVFGNKDTRHVYQVPFQDSEQGVNDMMEYGFGEPSRAIWFIRNYVLESFSEEDIVNP